MDLDALRHFFGWCTLINYAALLFWFFCWVVCRDTIYGIHSRWFSIPRDRYDQIHFQLLGSFKLAVLILNLTPYLALRILGG